MDLTTGDRSILSGDGVGTGRSLGAPVSILLGDTPDHVFTLTASYDGVMRVDVNTGARQVVSWSYFYGATFGSGPQYGLGVTSMVRHPLTGDLLVLDHDHDLVYSTDPVTGHRSFTWGDGALNPTAIAINDAGTRLYAMDRDIRGGVSIDLETGVSTRFVGEGVGTGV